MLSLHKKRRVVLSALIAVAALVSVMAFVVNKVNDAARTYADDGTLTVYLVATDPDGEEYWPCDSYNVSGTMTFNASMCDSTVSDKNVTFVGFWDDQINGYGTYEDSYDYTPITDGTILWVVYGSNDVDYYTYTLKFDENTGNVYGINDENVTVYNMPEDKTCTTTDYSCTFTLTSSDMRAYRTDGYVLVGWTDASLNHDNYVAGNSVIVFDDSPNQTKTLYAVWEESEAVAKADQTVTFDKEAVSMSYAATSFINAATTTGDGVITYSSNNTDVAIVESGAGIVSIVGAGEAVITATAASTDNYNEASASYTLTVESVRYDTLNGSGQNYVLDEDEYIEFDFAVDYDKFKEDGEVYVDEQLLDNEYYEVEGDSEHTVIKILNDYLDNLGVGKHEVIIIFDNNGGTATAKFTIVEVESESELATPDTGVSGGSTNGSLITTLGFPVLALSMVVGATIYRRKNAHRKFGW